MPFENEKIWAVLKDFPNVQNFNPAVKKSYKHDGPDTDVGARRHCDLIPFGTLEEKIIEYKENESMKIDIYDGKKLPPINNMMALFQLKNIDDLQTKVTFEFSYDPKGLAGKVMDKLMIRPQFQSATDSFLKGLEFYVRTGRKISKKELKGV